MSEFNFAGAPQISTALEILFQRHAHTLNQEELRWFAGLSDVAEFNVQQLKDICESIGCAVQSENKSGTFESKDGVTALAWMVKNQLDAVQGLIVVSSAATDRLLHPEHYERIDRARISK